MQNREVELGQHHKMAKKWMGPFRIFRIHPENTSVVEIRSVWNRMDERNVNVALLKRAYVREGDEIPEDIKEPEKEKKEEEKEKGEEEETGTKQRKRGRRAGRKKNKTREEETNEEIMKDKSERIPVRNREGRTKYTQVVCTGEGKKKEWTKEEEEKEWVLKGIVQEIELLDRSEQYRMQFEGFKKLSDARWMDADRVRKDWPELVEDWERKKRVYGVKKTHRKDGVVTTLDKKEKKKGTGREENSEKRRTKR